MTNAEALGDRVVHVLDAVIAEGVPVGAAERQRIMVLITRLIAAGRAPLDGLSLGRVLAPLLARSAHEQGRVQALAEAAFADRRDSPEPPAPSLAPQAERGPLGGTRRWPSVLISVAAVGFAALLAWFAWRHWHVSLEKPLETPPSPSGSLDALDWLPRPPPLPVPDWPWDRTWRWYFSEYTPSKWAALLFPWLLFAFAMWPLWRSLGAYLRRQDALRRFSEERIRLRSAAVPLLNKRRLAWTVQRMRRMPADSQTEFAVEASVHATTAAAGLPVLVMASRTVSIPYIALLERISARDHQADLFSLMLRALQDAGLHVEVWEFSGDPRFLRGPGGRAAVLDELMRGHPDRRLLMLADGSCLIDPVTGVPAPWATTLLNAAARVLLTPRPTTEWGALERMLAEQLGFRVEEATPEGIQRLATPAPVQRPLAAGATRILALHTFLASRPLLWTSAVRPAASTVRSLLATLSRGLDARCLSWLRALAVYPELRFPLTLHLGAQLAPAGIPEEMTRRTLALARLPWLRTGMMPGWLRQELLAGMSSAEEAAIRGFFRGEGGRAGLPINLDVLRPSASAPSRPPRDGVFLDFVYGLRRIRGIPVRLLQRLAALLRLRRVRRFLAAAVTGCVLASCLSALFLSLLPLDACDALGANVFDPDKVGAGVTPYGLALRPDAVDACRAAVKRDPKNGRWQYQYSKTLYARHQPDGGPLSKAAELGHPMAVMEESFFNFRDGDKITGREMLNRLRPALALNVEAWIAELGFDGQKDPETAVQKYEAAARAGSNYAGRGVWLLEDRGEWGRFFALAEREVSLGDPYSTNELGYWTERGKSEGEKVWRARDFAQAIHLYETAAAKGEDNGLHNFAIQLWKGSGIKEDDARACTLMWQSAYLGNLPGMVELASMLTAQDCSISGLTPWTLYQHAADADDVRALLALGDAYKEGRPGLPANTGEAVKYYRRITESNKATEDQKSEARKKIEELEKQP